MSRMAKLFLTMLFVNVISALIMIDRQVEYCGPVWLLNEHGPCWQFRLLLVVQCLYLLFVIVMLWRTPQPGWLMSDKVKALVEVTFEDLKAGDYYIGDKRVLRQPKEGK